VDKLGRWKWNQWQPLDYLGMLLMWFIGFALVLLVLGFWHSGLVLVAAAGFVLMVMIALFLVIVATTEDWKED
jgi:hypothetical protein